LNYYKQNAEDQATHWRERGCEVSEDELMTVAQHERIVGALRAELETERMRLAGCGVAALGYFDGCADAYKSASLSDVLRLRADCDAALARVAELELGIARIAGDFLPDNSGQAELALDEMRQTLHELLAAIPTQAQHSVPEVSGIGRDFAYPRSVVLYLRTEPTDDDLRAIHDGLRSLAAAPGKEGV
ncbi:hypothetical protein, partial [Pseudomonas aeruginosa]|uniref:hypothetical protein n=1 Tax=Pseudomonas aeruginosa TaxID=287 RepID=UPI001C4F25C6